MIEFERKVKPFSIKLADRVDKNGKIVRGKEVSFDSGFEMSKFWETQKPPTKRRRKKSAAKAKTQLRRKTANQKGVE